MPDDIRKAVYDAVVECVRRVGHESVDIRMIAREAGCSTGAVYTVAPNKATLLDEVRSDLIEKLENYLDQLGDELELSDYFDWLAREWGRDYEIAIYMSSPFNVTRTSRLPRSWFDASAAAGVLPAYEDRTEAYWKDFTDITAAVIANIAYTEPALVPQILRELGPDIQRICAAVLDLPANPIPDEIFQWVVENPGTYAFEDPMVEALFELQIVGGIEDPSVTEIAKRAECSSASVYRAGAVAGLRRRLADETAIPLAMGLDRFATVADRSRAMITRQVIQVGRYPQLQRLWGQVRPVPTFGNLKRSSSMNDWIRYHCALARDLGQIPPDLAPYTDLAAHLIVGPARMWGSKPGNEQKLIEWGLKVIDFYDNNV